MRFHDKWVPVTMAGCVFRLQMEKQPPIWKAVVRILNNQLLTADKGWSFSLGIGTNRPCYKTNTVFPGP